MGNSYRTFVEKERRLAVLRVTAEGSGVANDGLLKSVPQPPLGPADVE